jgi:hypothetical protein
VNRKAIDEADHVATDLPYWIYRYADGSEVVVNRRYQVIWHRRGIGTPAEAGGNFPSGFVDRRRFYGENPKHNPWRDPQALARLEQDLRDFVDGKDVWDQARFGQGYEPVRP